MDRELVKGLAKGVIAQQVPGEAEVFDSLADYYLDDPKPAAAASTGDKPLGSGLATTVEFLIPAALYVCERVLDLVTDAALEETGRGVVRLLRRTHKKRKPAEAEPAGDARDELAEARVALRGHEEQVRPAALAAGIAYGLPHDLAERLSDLVAAQVLDAQPAAESVSGSASPDASAGAAESAAATEGAAATETAGDAEEPSVS